MTQEECPECSHKERKLKERLKRDSGARAELGRRVAELRKDVARLQARLDARSHPPNPFS